MRGILLWQEAREGPVGLARVKSKKNPWGISKPSLAGASTYVPLLVKIIPRSMSGVCGVLVRLG